MKKLGGIGLSLSKLMEEKELSCYDLGKSLGITGQAISQYKKGRVPQYKHLVSIKNYFDVSYSYLFGETKEKHLSGDIFKYNLSKEALKKMEEIGLLSQKGDLSATKKIEILENLLLEQNNKTLNLIILLNEFYNT